jgi:type IV pilus assembly protein PilA
MDKLRQRLAAEEGFTLIELLVVIVIIGILLAIAVPSYLGFKDRANNRAAQSDVRAAIPSIEAFYSDNGKYTGVTTTKIRSSIDSGLSPKVKITVSGTTYCASATVGSKSWSVKGPGAAKWWNATSCSGAASTTNP